MKKARQADLAIKSKNRYAVQSIAGWRRSLQQRSNLHPEYRYGAQTDRSSAALNYYCLQNIAVGFSSFVVRLNFVADRPRPAVTVISEPGGASMHMVTSSSVTPRALHRSPTGSYSAPSRASPRTLAMSLSCGHRNPATWLSPATNAVHRHRRRDQRTPER